MECTIKIKMNNAAFNEDDPTEEFSGAAAGAELARILRHTAKRIADGVNPDEAFDLFDANGNKVGTFSIIP